MIRKGIALIIMLLFIGLIISPSFSTKQVSDYIETIPSSITETGYTNLTVQEAWELLNDLACIEIPIDVRRIDEWRAGRIDTPFPEHPRWYPLDLLKNSSILPKFLFQYENCKIIIYCKGGYRSFVATKILIANNFAGMIYNIVGGITEWNGSGYPTVPGGIYNLTVKCIIAQV